MISAELQKAIDSLQILDVYLRDFVAHCADGFEPKYNMGNDSLAFQTKHLVKQSTVVELEDAQRLLRVFVHLGARWVDEQAQSEEVSVRAFIEAEFVAEYAMPEDLEQTVIDAFALQNVSYHVWPYWRELLHSQCTRMHMPRVVLATVQLAHNRHPSADL